MRTATGNDSASKPDNDTQPGAPRRRKRYFAAGDVFFSVPARLYDGGYAARLSPAAIARYLTLLRVSNYDYGREIILLTATELALLDGVAPRTARGVYTKLRELGLLEKGPGNGRPASIVLVHPWLWPDLDGPKARLSRRDDGKLKCSCE